MRALLLVFLFACNNNATPEVHEVAEAGHEHGDHEHGAEAGHDHPARHGGQQVEAVGGHVEALFAADGVRFYLGNQDNLPVSPAGVSGSALISSSSGVQTVPLMVMGDALHAPLSLEAGKPAGAVLTITFGGQIQSLSFETKSVGTELHDHTALHGGQVVMSGNFHVELATKDDNYSVWVTDAARGPVAGATTAVLVDGDQRLDLATDASTGALTGRAEGAGSRPVTVEVTVDGQPFTVTFTPAAAGEGERHEHQHDH